jgi:hypothetical protein
MTRRAALLAATLAVLAGVARMRLQPEASALGAIRDPAFIPSGRAVRVVSAGQRLLLSDLYWLRAVQYVGESFAAKVDRWAALYPLVELVTDLDPRHGYAYQVAGSNLAGIAHRYDEAGRILRKGMRNLPDRWTLPWTYAVNKYLFEGDFAEAARYARIAGEVGRRPHLALLAANLSLVTDDAEEYAAAIAFLEQAIRSADGPELEAQLEARLVKVRTYEVLSRAEKAVAAFQARWVRRPLALEELVAAGLLVEVPPDPAGGRILYDLASGKVRSSALGERRPVKHTMASR